MAIDISGIQFFMPVFSFLLVFVIVYALLAKTKVIGESKWILILISFIIAIIFMSFSSMELYVQTIVPWFVILFIVVFFILLIGFFSSKDWVPKPWLAWIIIAVLIIIFLIAAIKVFNPIFHPDLIVASGEGTSLVEQIKDYLGGGIMGSILLLIVAGVVAWVITKK